MNAITPSGSNALMPTNMDTAIQLAEMMSRGKLVPQHLQGSPGDCLMVIEASMRWGMSPFAVAQCTSVIQGKLMFEGKLVAAALHASGIMSSRLDYEFSGADGGRVVTVRGVLRGEDKPREIVLTLAEAKTSNGMWTKQPDQQLVYAGTRVWARRHAPEVMLGVYTPEEFDEQQPREVPFAGTTLEHRAVEPQSTNPPRITATTKTPRATPPRETNGTTAAPRTDAQWRAWLDKLKLGVGAVHRRSEVEEIGDRSTVGDATATGPEWVRKEIAAILAAGVARFTASDVTTDPETGELPAVEIEGEKYLGAG